MADQETPTPVIVMTMEQFFEKVAPYTGFHPTQLLKFAKVAADENRDFEMFVSNQKVRVARADVLTYIEKPAPVEEFQPSGVMPTRRGPKPPVPRGARG